MNAAARQALGDSLADGDIAPAAIPRRLSQPQRALLVQMLHAGGLERREVVRDYGRLQLRRHGWCLRGTDIVVHGYTVEALIKRRLALRIAVDGKICRARLTLMGHWFAETLDAQWQRGTFASEKGDDS